MTEKLYFKKESYRIHLVFRVVLTCGFHESIDT